MEFFNQLLFRDLTPHGFCYRWDPRTVAMLIAFASRVTSLPGRTL
jgi:hypothetical protein